MKQKLKNLRRLRPSCRAVVTVIAFCLPFVIGWYAGYDMLERGSVQALGLAASCWLAGVTQIWPWSKEQRNG